MDRDIDMEKTVVAIFEDDLVNRYIYEKTFQKRDDIMLLLFDSLEKGLDKLKDYHPDVVFIEAHFHGNFGGVSIIKSLRAITTDRTVFIAMTSLLQKGDLEHLMSAGFMMCLEKPIAFNEVLKANE
ncbi:MAG TPA: response regulator [Chryseosolibacter sp.]